MMESNPRKRRSDEAAYVPQSKMHVSEKIMEQSDTSKMKRIHEKTIEKLFGGASRFKPEKPDNDKEMVPLCQQYLLSGNGTVQLRSLNVFCDDNANQAKSKCCQRLTYIRDGCSNCSLPMCEFCGFSCSDCGSFLCFNCVSVFGCGPPEHPICEKCALYA